MKPRRYKHYKGQLYEVIALARHTETLEEMVVYKALYGDYKIWVRPKLLFDQLITYEESGKKIKRFEYVN